MNFDILFGLIYSPIIIDLKILPLNYLILNSHQFNALFKRRGIAPLCY